VLNIVRFEYYGKFFAVSYHYPLPKIMLFTYDKEVKRLGEIATKNKINSFDIAKSANEPYQIRVNTNAPEG